MRATGLGLADALATVTAHPARLLGRPEPTLAAGQPANLVVFRRRRRPRRSFRLLRTCVDGDWTEARDGRPEPLAVGLTGGRAGGRGRSSGILVKLPLAGNPRNA